MKKKLWTLALAFCLVSAMLPGGVFHAERAWAEDASSVTASTVSIAGLTLSGTTPHYYNGTNGGVGEVTDTKDKGEPNATFDASTGTLTLNGLNLTVSGDTKGISANGALAINLEGSSKLETKNLAIHVWSGNLTISGTGSLEAKNENTGSENSLIYAQGNIVINGGAQVIATTKSRAQAINANAGNMEIADEGTTVKAVNENPSSGNADAIRANASSTSVGDGTVTVTGGATLEAETKSKNAKAINGNVIATGSKIKAGDSKKTATPLTGTSISAENTYKYVRIGEEEPNYLTFTAVDGPATIKFSWKTGSDVQISRDGGQTWTGYDAKDIISLNTNETVKFKGTYITTGIDSNGVRHCFEMSGQVSASGSVTSLTDGNGNDPEVTIGEKCYYGMFWECKSLTTAPELPAVNLATQCYEYMFYSCTSLTTAPKLPAKSLAEKCYEEMFNKCKSLTTAPDLPAIEAKKSCYEKMFYDCKSLTMAPKLSATTLANNCYNLMFYGCSALQAAPELPATNLAYSCYSNMFTGCSTLKEVPTLPATILAEECYKKMFSGCKGLTTVPALPATTLANDCYNGMFENCRNLSMRGESNKSSGYTEQWKIPANNATAVTDWNTNMFACDTGISNDVNLDGKGLKVPQANVTYYQKGSNSGGETHTHAFNIEKASSEYLKSAATCQAQAVYYKSCTCGAKGTETFTYGEKAEHIADTTKWVYDAATHWRVCKNCKAVMDNTKTAHNFENGKCKVCDYKEGSTVNPTPNPTPSGSSGGGYIAPSTDVKTSGSADSKVTSSPSTVQNETRTDASGKQETVAKVTVSAANQREILSQAKANKSKRIIIQIAKTAVQGDAKLELNLDKTFVQSILHDTEASLTIRTADGDKVIAREALKTLVAQTEGNTVVIDPAAQENPTDPAEPSKAETLAALDSSRLVARSKLVTLKNGKKGIRITWSDKNGAEMNFDGVEIYRSTKKNRFGKKPFYATKGGKSAGYYINSKSLKSGVTYYYKVRGYVLIDGRKHYTDLSLKAIRTVK